MNERYTLQLRFLFFYFLFFWVVWYTKSVFCSRVAEYTYTERLGFYVSLRCFEGNFEKWFFPPVRVYCDEFLFCLGDWTTRVTLNLEEFLINWSDSE
jgi:hypothetical protein